MLISAIVRTVYLLLTFLAGLVLSKLVLPGQFGIISLVILNASLLSIVTGLGTDSLILHKVTNNKWGFSQAAQFTLGAVAVQLVLFLALEFGSLLVWKKTLLSDESPAYFWTDTLYFSGLLLTEKYLALLYAFQKARIVNIFLAIVALFYLIVLLLLSFVAKADFATVMELFALQSLLQGLGLLSILYLHYKTEEKQIFKLVEFAQALKLSSVVMVTNVIQLLAYRIDFWLIKYFHGNADVGIYALANKFANLVWVVPNIMAQLLIPRFAQMSKNEISKIFSTAFYGNLIGAVAALSGATIIYFYYLDPVYRTGLPAFFLMLPGYFFWAAVVYYGAYFSWSGRFSDNLLCSSCCFVLVFLADMLLIPRFGISGAACANSFAYTLVFMLYLFLLRSRFSFTWKSLLLPPQKGLLKLLKSVAG